MARDRLLRAWLSGHRLKLVERMLLSADAGFTGHHGDLWIGPTYRASIPIPADGVRLVLHLRHVHQGAHQRVNMILMLNRKTVIRHTAATEGEFTLEADLARIRGQHAELEIRNDSFFVPRFVHGTPDDRELSIQLLKMHIERRGTGPTGAQSG
jgi:hypothetical protein